MGYGGAYALAGVVMLCGIGVCALWTAILVTGFSHEMRRSEFLRTWDLVARVPFLRGLGFYPQTLEGFFETSQRRASRSLLFHQPADLSHCRCGFFRKTDGLLVQLDIVGQKPRAVHAHSF